MSWMIVSDTSCEIRELEDLCAGVQFGLVPFKIRVGEREFVDLPTLSVRQMLKTMTDYKGGSSTACPSPEEWAEQFLKADNVIAITISHNLSGSYNAAQSAREMVLDEYPDKNIFILDTLSCAGALAEAAVVEGLEVIAADSDPASVEKIYMAGNGEGKIVEMVQDLSNPSPGLGLFNCERTSFLERINGSDCVLGLALIHHLRVSANWPLERIVKLFSDCAPAALVEFIPRDDPRFLQLLRSRPDI